jgi:hypothetical protein
MGAFCSKMVVNLKNEQQHIVKKIEVQKGLNGGG